MQKMANIPLQQRNFPGVIVKVVGWILFAKGYEFASYTGPKLRIQHGLRLVRRAQMVIENRYLSESYDIVLNNCSFIR